MPEIIGGLLLCAVFALYLLFVAGNALVKCLSDKVRSIYRTLSGEKRREEEQWQREYREKVEAETQFEQALARDAFPDEDVLSRLESESVWSSAPEAIGLRFGSRKYSEIVKLARRERNAELEMRRVGCEYRKVEQLFAALRSSSGEWDEASRMRNALFGTSDDVTLGKVLRSDVVAIARSMASASGSTSDMLAFLVQRVCTRFDPNTEHECYTIDSCSRGVSSNTNRPIGVPLTLEALRLSLRCSDVVCKSDLEPNVAAAFSLFVEEAAKCVPSSPAVTVAKNTYLSFIASLNSGQGSKSTASDSNTNCKSCVRFFEVLDLPFGTGNDDVKARRRAFAEVLHPDQLGNKSERARHMAEEQLKKINEACDHILACKLPRSMNQSAGM